MYNKKEDENCVGEEEEFTTMQLWLSLIALPLWISPFHPMDNPMDQWNEKLTVA